MSEGHSSRPRISVVIPSFNQAQYIGDTLESIFSQQYPNLECIVMDGGSTDGSVEIIRKYESKLAFWVSEKDNGQSHAINKGMAKATGDILAYLNSDDLYLPDTFESVVSFWRTNPTVDLIHGRCRVVNSEGIATGERTGKIRNYPEILDLWGVWWAKHNFVQPEVFWTRRVADKVGKFREDLNLVMDYEYWARILQTGAEVGFLDKPLASFRVHAQQKSTQPQRTAAELLNVVKEHLWGAELQLTRRERLRLRGNWQFDAVFRPMADLSVEVKESRIKRWWKLSQLVLRHPELLASNLFRQRVGLQRTIS